MSPRGDLAMPGQSGAVGTVDRHDQEQQVETRKKRANGEESRQRIIMAAIEIAGERGYEGTSISAVSERSGLPASSIYWHFKDKDDLLAAVIDHSFARWLEHLGADPPTPEGTDDSRTASVRSAAGVQRAIAAAPDFLRLGLMLTLERRQEEPLARSKFLAVRHAALENAISFYGRLHRDRLTPRDIRMVAVMAMAIADGLFIAHEVEGDDFPAQRMFELAGVAVDAVAQELIADRDRRRAKRAR